MYIVLTGRRAQLPQMPEFSGNQIADSVPEDTRQHDEIPVWQLRLRACEEVCHHVSHLHCMYCWCAAPAKPQLRPHHPHPRASQPAKATIPNLSNSSKNNYS